MMMILCDIPYNRAKTASMRLQLRSGLNLRQGVETNIYNRNCDETGPSSALHLMFTAAKLQYMTPPRVPALLFDVLQKKSTNNSTINIRRKDQTKFKIDKSDTKTLLCAKEWILNLPLTDL